MTTQARCCDICHLYNHCYLTPFGNRDTQIRCEQCVLRTDGGKEWLDQYKRDEEYKARRRVPDKSSNDYAFHDWYSTAPRMSGSHRLTNDGRVVKQNGYNNRRDEDY